MLLKDIFSLATGDVTNKLSNFPEIICNTHRLKQNIPPTPLPQSPHRMANLRTHTQKKRWGKKKKRGKNPADWLIRTVHPTSLWQARWLQTNHTWFVWSLLCPWSILAIIHVKTASINIHQPFAEDGYSKLLSGFALEKRNHAVRFDTVTERRNQPKDSPRDMMDMTCVSPALSQSVCLQQYCKSCILHTARAAWRERWHANTMTMTTRDNERLHKIHGIERAVKNTHLSCSIVTQRSKRHNDETWRPLQSREPRTQRWTPHSHSLFTVSWDKTPPTPSPRHMAREENEYGDTYSERRDTDLFPLLPDP